MIAKMKIPKSVNLASFVALLILSSCSIKKESVIGKYVFIDKHNGEFSEHVQLYDDGTFNYHISSSLFIHHALKGTWRLSHHTVILNSAHISVIDNDTVKLKNSVYKIRCGDLKHYMSGLHRYRILKKMRTL